MPKFKTNKPKKKFKPIVNNDGISEIKQKLEWLDPFHYVDVFVMPYVKARTDSGLVEGLVNLIFAALFAGIIYYLLGLIFGTATPLVIVYSESMEPDFFRGDVMALSRVVPDSVSVQEINLERNISGLPSSKYVTPRYVEGRLTSLQFENGKELFPNEEGSVIVYPSYPQGLPIIHRTIVKINATDGTFYLTKGDNSKTNPTFDQDCGEVILNNSDKPCITLYAVEEETIQGKSFFKIPAVGCLKLWLVDDLLSIVTTGKLPSNFNGIC